jgi:NADH dehydrogenase
MTIDTFATRHRVARNGTLVLGGGFAGGYVARRLGRAGATIVNPTNFMLYTPLLPEAAAGTVEPRHVAVPLRAMCPHADLVVGSVTSIDAEHRVATVRSDAGTFAIAYAELVVALGSVTRMPDVPGLREHAFGLKDLQDAIRLRNQVLHQLELADAAPDSAERRLTFVVAGAGFAGVEAIAELNELVEEALTRHPRLRHVKPRWLLVDGGSRILGQTPDGLAEFAHRTLADRGVEILTHTRLTGVEPGGITLSDGRSIATETVIWTAGVTPNPIVSELGLPCDERGRIQVDETMRVAGSRHVWALGDCAAVPNAATPGVFDPPTCQHALRQAKRLAGNLLGPPQPYRFKSLGQMATLGKRHGIALVGNIPVSGILGWHISRAYHLMQMPFMARRARVLNDWATAALFRRDVAELTAVNP